MGSRGGQRKPTRLRQSVVQPGNLDADRPARVASSREGRGIERLARMLADGMLRVPVQATYEFAQAPDALNALATTHTQGKLAIRIR